MRANNISKLSQGQRRKFNGVVRSIKLEWDESEKDISYVAWKLVSGSIPTRTFVLYGHPLGKNNAVTVSKMTKSGHNRLFRVTKEGSMVPLLPINAQTNRLRNSMRVVRRTSKGVVNRFLFFTARYAKYALSPEGTKTTVSRGFWTALYAYQRTRKKQILNAAQKGLKA